MQGKLIGCVEITVGMTAYIRKACDSVKNIIHLDKRSLDVETLGFKLHKEWMLYIAARKHLSLGVLSEY